MGFDLASIHAGEFLRSARAIKKDLDKRPRGWLNEAAATAAERSKARFSGMAELTRVPSVRRSQTPFVRDLDPRPFRCYIAGKACPLTGP